MGHFHTESCLGQPTYTERNFDVQLMCCNLKLNPPFEKPFKRDFILAKAFMDRRNTSSICFKTYSFKATSNKTYEVCNQANSSLTQTQIRLGGLREGICTLQSCIILPTKVSLCQTFSFPPPRLMTLRKG